MNIKDYLHNIKYKLGINKRIWKLAILCFLPYNIDKKLKHNKVIWFGAYGNTNIGDNLIFFSIRKYFSEETSIRLSCRERNSSVDFGVQTFYKPDFPYWSKLMKKSDFVLLGGGGLFEYYKGAYKSAESWILSHLTPLVYARHFGKSYGIIGIGCNNIPIPNPLVRYVFKKVSNDAVFIITRDQKSRDGFEINGVDNINLRFCFDPVFNYMPVKKNETRLLSKTVGLLIWPYYLWPHFHNTTDIDAISKRASKDKLNKHYKFVDELKTCIEELERKGIRCIFPVFHFSDVILHKELGVSCCNTVPTIASYFDTISQCDIIVTMRYHGQITSLLCGKPILSILVQEKMEALVDNFRIRDSMSIDIESFNSDKLLDMIDYVYKNFEKISSDLYRKTIEKQNFVNNTYINSFKSL